MSAFDCRVLIVDDEPAVTATLRLVLQRAGYANVRTENNPRLVQQAVAEFDPKIMLLDISMPELDGLKVLEQLSDRIIDDSITVIMVTASSEEHSKRKALILGACDFIAKPVDPEELVTRVGHAAMGRPNMDFILHSLPPKASHSVPDSNNPPAIS